MWIGTRKNLDGNEKDVKLPPPLPPKKVKARKIRGSGGEKRCKLFSIRQEKIKGKGSLPITVHIFRGRFFFAPKRLVNRPLTAHNFYFWQEFKKSYPLFEEK